MSSGLYFVGLHLMQEGVLSASALPATVACTHMSQSFYTACAQRFMQKVFEPVQVSTLYPWASS